MDKSLVLGKLRHAKNMLISLGVAKVGLFGSTVRGENTPTSDVDILIDFQKDKETYSNYISVCEQLEKLFTPIRLDIVTMNGLSPHIGKQILNEVEYV